MSVDLRKEVEAVEPRLVEMTERALKAAQSALADLEAEEHSLQVRWAAAIRGLDASEILSIRRRQETIEDDLWLARIEVLKAEISRHVEALKPLLAEYDAARASLPGAKDERQRLLMKAHGLKVVGKYDEAREVEAEAHGVIGSALIRQQTAELTAREHAVKRNEAERKLQELLRQVPGRKAS